MPINQEIKNIKTEIGRLPEEISNRISKLQPKTQEKQEKINLHSVHIMLSFIAVINIAIAALLIWGK